MSSAECLREFVNERLTAAAEEIFRVLKKTIVEYEEEIDRQRRLLDIIWKPHMRSHMTDVPQKHVCQVEEADQQLCDQERNSSLDQEDPEPPQIKEELCTSQEGEQLVVKLETDTFILIPPYEGNDHGEPEPESDHQLSLNSHIAESEDQKGGEHGDSGSTRETEPEPKERHHISDCDSNGRDRSNRSEIRCKTNTGKKSFRCDACGKTFQYKSKWSVHLRSHTGEKPYFCEYCGKRFSHSSSLNAHVRLHTGEKPYSCKICGKGFRLNSGLLVHTRTHTGEKPYSCKTCGKDFPFGRELKVHMRTHTGDKPYLCQICGKRFNQKSELKNHARIHTGEKPYCCNTCGKRFSQLSSLNVHMRLHTGEKPYSCETCGKGFRVSGHLTIHIRRAHTGEKPYLCKICGKRYFDASHLAKHIRSHTGK
ncbi:uncharacterized protein [Pagrus major]|uniref:uncharacterized protein n=1 Tax=Pagrus major TaxID=143350 RepID=UPI003CC8844F